MRVNVYSQELTHDTEIVTKEGKDKDGEPAVFVGLRIFLQSSEYLHHTPDDDDRSAVTFWLPKSAERTHEFVDTLYRLAGMALDTIQV